MIKEYIKLIRPFNVAFVVIIQVMTYCWMIVPTLNVFGLEPLAEKWMVCIIIAATALIAAGGYVINDYFDLKIDLINKPDKMIVGRTIGRHEAMKYYQVLTCTGIALGLTPAIITRSMTIGLIFMIVPGMLWFYSATYKRQLIIGNIIVALSAGLVPMIPLTLEITAQREIYGEMIYSTPMPQTLYAWVCGMALFSFLFTLIREITKDIQDQKGDREYECHTIPIVWGETTAKIIIDTLTVVTNALLVYMITCIIPFEGTVTVRYFTIGIALPSAAVAIMIWKREYVATASGLLKFVMLVGVMYIPVYYFLLSTTYGIPFMGIFEVVAGK